MSSNPLLITWRITTKRITLIKSLILHNKMINPLTYPSIRIWNLFQVKKVRKTIQKKPSKNTISPHFPSLSNKPLNLNVSILTLPCNRPMTIQTIKFFCLKLYPRKIMKLKTHKVHPKNHPIQILHLLNCKLLELQNKNSQSSSTQSFKAFSREQFLRNSRSSPLNPYFQSQFTKKMTKNNKFNKSTLNGEDYPSNLSIFTLKQNNFLHKKLYLSLIWTPNFPIHPVQPKKLLIQTIQSSKNLKNPPSKQQIIKNTKNKMKG